MITMIIAVREPKRKIKAKVKPRRVSVPIRLTPFLPVHPPLNPKPPLAYAPVEISAYGKRYRLHEPLVCQVEYIAEDKYYHIEHEELSIFCGGDTLEEACQEFNEWFVHNYIDFNELGESRLCLEYVVALRLMNRLVKEEV
jgi:hypothetical protein